MRWMRMGQREHGASRRRKSPGVPAGEFMKDDMNNHCGPATPAIDSRRKNQIEAKPPGNFVLITSGRAGWRNTPEKI